MSYDVVIQELEPMLYMLGWQRYRDTAFQWGHDKHDYHVNLLWVAHNSTHSAKISTPLHPILGGSRHVSDMSAEEFKTFIKELGT